jgi:hypothetical protein
MPSAIAIAIAISAAIGGFIRRVSAACSSYRSLVLSKKYMTSRVSRRASWGWLMPSLAVFYPLAGCMYYCLSLPIPYAALTLSTIATVAASRMSTSGLLPDALIIAAHTLSVNTFMPNAFYHLAYAGISQTPMFSWLFWGCLFTH